MSINQKTKTILTTVFLISLTLTSQTTTHTIIAEGDKQIIEKLIKDHLFRKLALEESKFPKFTVSGEKTIWSITKDDEGAQFFTNANEVNSEQYLQKVEYNLVLNLYKPGKEFDLSWNCHFDTMMLYGNASVGTIEEKFLKDEKFDEGIVKCFKLDEGNKLIL